MGSLLDSIFYYTEGGIGVYLGVCCLVFCTIQGGYWGIFGSLLDSILYYTGVLGVFGSLLDSILHFLYYRGGWVSKIEICYKVLIHAVDLYMDPPLPQPPKSQIFFAGTRECLWYKKTLITSYCVFVFCCDNYDYSKMKI